MESNRKTTSQTSRGRICRTSGEWNDTGRAIDARTCIHQQLEEQAQRTPDRTALIFRDRRLSYRELASRAHRIAAQLRSAGAGPDRLIGICANRSLDMVAAMWGIMESGGAYLPLDPAFPSTRIDFMLSDSEAAIVVTESALASRFARTKARIICLDHISEASVSEPIDQSVVHPDHLAYVIYTSGSTGMPKGVMVEHRNVANLFSAMDQVIGSAPGVWLALTSISFDISVLELLWTLSRGFTVVVQADEDKLVVRGEYSIVAQLQRHQVTHLQCTPSHASMLWLLPGAPAAMASVRKLLIGGEAMPVALARRLRESLTAEIFNMYGPTETTVWSSSYKLSSLASKVPIGTPIANTSMYIVDDHGTLAARGEPGELYIGGAGVARGYLKRPELTQERFAADRFANQSGARLYRTGDRVRRLADGNLEFLGRTDLQIKLRGYRIELGEIEATLASHPAVEQSAVVPREADGSQLLAAFVTTRPQHRTSAKELQIFVGQRLPDYMVPSRISIVPQLPMTPNGKIDRKALQSVRWPALNEDQKPSMTSDLESDLIEIWKDTLGIERVGCDENLFDLGATSLNIAEATATICARLMREIKVTDLFTHPTISSFATFINDGKAKEANQSLATSRGNARRAALSRRTHEVNSWVENK